MLKDAAADRSTRVLLVDGDVDLLNLLTYALELRGYSVARAQDAQSALAVVAEAQLDLVLLGCCVPFGFELCRHIHATSPLPIIMLTALSSDECGGPSLDDGADEYVVKPFSLKVLAARMEALLRHGRAVAKP